MNGQNRKVTLRERLFRRQRGLCYYCRQPMILNPPTERHKTEDPRMCTLEHVHDRWSPWRGKLGDRNVAACKKCNNARGAARERLALAIIRNGRGILV